MTDAEKLILENQNLLLACNLFLVQRASIDIGLGNAKIRELYEKTEEHIFEQRGKIENMLGENSST